jgi:hypothetical protein
MSVLGNRRCHGMIPKARNSVGAFLKALINNRILVMASCDPN